MAPFGTNLHTFRPAAISFLVKLDPAQEATIRKLVAMLCEAVDREARINELRRVKSATLDADTDVWSKDDAGQVISLMARLRSL